MTKQMHQVDDEENPSSAGFWHPKQKSEGTASDSGFSLKAESPARAPRSTGPSGQEEHGMGKQNPFENWRVKAPS